jgi:ATP-binding cassette subfamily F protein 3
VTLLSFGAVGVRFGVRTLLRDVTFTVSAGERWGIVGRNGAGKTTLFRLLTGELEPSSGSIARADKLRIAMLDQLRDFGNARTVWDAAAAGYHELLTLEAELVRQEHRLAELGESVTEADLTRYGHDQERFAHSGGYEFRARVDAVLQGLGFDAAESRARPLAGLSGGEQGRLGLAAQLAAPADLVLLDEPTNHLDLETIDWLRKYLGEFGETVIVISHDRAFLDASVDHVLHVAEQTATPYRGGYSAFVTQRAERLLALERQVEQQRKKIAKEEDYIRRHIAGQNTAQAKGRRRRLDRLPRLSPPPGEADAMALRFDATDRAGDQVVIVDKLKVTVGERTLVRDFSAVGRRGDVIALVGPNGAGKTTFLSTLLGERSPVSGAARLGANVSASWFRQDLAQVPRDKTLYECIAAERPTWGRGPIQGVLGAFGFSGDEVLRSTSQLSGGEQARMALALMTLAHANLLILDEPTNHLDVESIEALEDALEEYEGTVIMVSHDRAFLRELATRVWAFDGNRIESFDGTFAEWEVARAERARAAGDGRRTTAERKSSPAQREQDQRRRSDSELRSARREAESLEEEVHRLESRIEELERGLADPSRYGSGAESIRKAAADAKALDSLRVESEAVMAKWMEAVETVSRLATRDS